MFLTFGLSGRYLDFPHDSCCLRHWPTYVAHPFCLRDETIISHFVYSIQVQGYNLVVGVKFTTRMATTIFYELLRVNQT